MTIISKPQQKKDSPIFFPLEIFDDLTFEKKTDTDLRKVELLLQSDVIA